jgi:hypothetical protein
MGAAAVATLLSYTSTCHSHITAPDVCGKSLGTGAQVPVVHDATSGDRTVTLRSVGDEFWLRLTDSCSNGVTLRAQPPDAATLIKQIPASDGKPVVVELRANQPDFALLLSRPNGAHSTVRITLQS